MLIYLINVAFPCVYMYTLVFNQCQSFTVFFLLWWVQCQVIHVEVVKSISLCLSACPPQIGCVIWFWFIAYCHDSLVLLLFLWSWSTPSRHMDLSISVMNISRQHCSWMKSRQISGWISPSSGLQHEDGRGGGGEVRTAERGGEGMTARQEKM